MKSFTGEADLWKLLLKVCQDLSDLRLQEVPDLWALVMFRATLMSVLVAAAAELRAQTGNYILS